MSVFARDIAIVPLGLIKINRDARQRREVDPTDLLPSIAQRGIMNPLIVDPDFNLIAGERRYAAATQLGLAEVPVRMTTGLAPAELQIIELEENLKREQLDWKDTARAALRIHNIYRENSPGHTQSQTAEMIGVKDNWMMMQLSIARELDKPDNPIVKCTGTREAYNVIVRKQERERAGAFQEMIDDVKLSEEDIMQHYEAELLGVDNNASRDIVAATVIKPATKPDPQEEVILNVSFLEWAPKYNGLTFNFIHFDPPYGIDFAAGPQGRGSDGSAIYSDSPEVFDAIMHCFCSNIDRLMAKSGHVMLWYGEKNRKRMFEIIEQYDTKISWQTHPLIWLKSDNAGISPDASRLPRHVYETALVGVRGDHKIVKVKADAYASSSDRRLHPSTKPEPMLRHFFEMFVDEHSRVLDPTCGSGAALRAADSLRAKAILGLEVDPLYFAPAKAEFVKSRVLRNIEI